MENDSLIRVARAEDKSRINEIIDLSFQKFFRFFASHSVNSESGCMFVAEAEGVVVGFVKLIEFNIGNIKYGCILWIAVHPAFRRKGVALNLTSASLETLKKKGSKAVFASTQLRNISAKGALSKAGFQRMSFLDLVHFFGWRVFSFFGEIWYTPGEIVYMCNLKS